MSCQQQPLLTGKITSDNARIQDTTIMNNKTLKSSPRGEVALAYAKIDNKILQIGEKETSEDVKRKASEAISDKETITKWRKENPKVNIGLLLHNGMFAWKAKMGFSAESLINEIGRRNFRSLTKTAKAISIGGDERYVPFNASNRGLCPFHEKKSANSSANAREQHFYCFSCGTGGRMGKILKDYEQLTYFETYSNMIIAAGGKI